jgi:protoporphyrinogen/coproporphyrinogen III oxidase
MKRAAIVGGGISGLAAAYTLEEQRRKTGTEVECFLYESSSRLGGVLRTEKIDGCIVEAGPDSFLTEKSAAADLCRALGLGDQLIASNDAQRKTYILVHGRLVEIPDGLMFLVPTKIIPIALSPLFSWRTKLRMFAELFGRPRLAGDDQSVASFVGHHYGLEMVDRLADPMLSGIYGGEAANLSVRAVLPRLADTEQTHGSLGRAMLAARRKNPPQRHQQQPIFTSLKDGMQQLTDALLSRLSPSSLGTGRTVREIRREQDRWLISTQAQSETFDAVILATPAHVAAQLLSNTHPELAAELSGIAYTSSLTIALGFDRRVRRRLPSGFGLLVPRSEGRRLLAVTFVHNKFPFRVPEDRALLRCFIGGGNAEALWPSTDEQIVSMVCHELRQILGVALQPLFSRVYRWKSAMAQYGVGHLQRLDRIEHLRRRLSGLALAGNAYRGIGIPDCIRSGSEAAQEILACGKNS